jgi:hypothetical protein
MRSPRRLASSRASLLAELDASDAVVVDIETEGQESADSILSALETLM